MAQRLAITDTLRKAVTSYFLRKGYSCHEEQGLLAWGKLRADVLCINLAGELVLVEIKSSLSDYTSDKKWHKYLEYCNKMYFCFPPSLYQRIDASQIKANKVGVLELDQTTGYLRCVYPAKRKSMKKKIKYSLLIRLAWRTGTSKRNSRRKRQYLKGD